MGCVFDYMKAVACGELLNSVHIAGLPGKMDWEYSASPAGNLLSSLFGIDTESNRVHIHQHGNRFKVNNHLGRRCKRGCGHEDFITRLQSHGLECQVQRGGTGTHADGVPGTHIGGKVLLEFDGLRAHGEPTGTDNVRSGGGLVFSDACGVKWNCLLFDFH
jgi:hypothetical protein